MKVCKRCGAIYEDDHSYCVDCEEYLGSPVSKEEETSINAKVSETVTKLSNRTDYFYVSKTDKIIAALHAAGALISLIIMVFVHVDIVVVYYIGLFMTFLIMAWEALDIRFPRISWAIYRARFLSVVANPEDIQPSEFTALFKRKLAYIILAAGYFFLTITFIQLIIISVSGR